LLSKPNKADLRRGSEKLLSALRSALVYLIKEIRERTQKFLARFKNPVFASGSYRYLARKIALDMSDSPTGNSIVFSSATDMSKSSEVLLMLSHFLHDELSCSVLIIDATFRNNGLTKLLGLEERPGIIDVLVPGDNSKPDFASVTHDLKGNISLISAGVVQQQRVPYVSEEQVQGFIDEFKTQYDFVILQQDEIQIDTRYLPYAKSADLVLLHLEERSTAIESFDEKMDVFRNHNITNVKYILSEE
jgi:Mrp family chromosome partitioning ATPase